MPLSLSITMSTLLPAYQFIETQQEFEKVIGLLSESDWVALDTEFVGERRFQPLLCLIQLAGPNGNFLIDSIKIKNLQSLLDLIEDPRITKITHAGENDYRIFFDQFNILPQNVWDTQIAAGFLGYGYPTGFNKLVQGELNIQLNKQSAVTNWEARPFSNGQLLYALNDVIYLNQIRTNQIAKLERKKRLAWAQEEMVMLQFEDFYFRNADIEALGSNILNHYNIDKQVFLLNLFRWRWDEAQSRNVAKETVLPVKFFGDIARTIEQGKKPFFENRLLPDRIVREHSETWLKLWHEPKSDEDIALIKKRKSTPSDDSEAQLTKDLLHLLVKYRCNEVGVAHTLVLDKSELSPARAPVFGEDEVDWRKELLGEDLIGWLHRRDKIHIELESGQCVITMK
jgi:ribonuclease D